MGGGAEPIAAPPSVISLSFFNGKAQTLDAGFAYGAVPKTWCRHEGSSDVQAVQPNSGASVRRRLCRGRCFAWATLARGACKAGNDPC